MGSIDATQHEPSVCLRRQSVNQIATHFFFACAVSLVMGCALDFDKFPSESAGGRIDQGIDLDMMVVDMMPPVQVDSDNDGVFDRNDNCPALANEDQEDLDGDGEGDVCDDDVDGDRIGNDVDICPRTRDPNQTDFDDDGLGDACDDDTDGDGILNDVDNCVLAPNPDQRDLDRDGEADACDADLDNDGLSNEAETQLGMDPKRADTDADGLPDDIDTCPLTVDPTNTDADGDGRGRVCDIDDDADGIFDYEDNCLGLSNPQQTDGDGNQVGDDCADDFDGDGIGTADDNCPYHPNPDQGYQPCGDSISTYYYDRAVRSLDQLNNATFVTTQETVRRIENDNESLIAGNFLSNQIKPVSVFPRNNGQLFVVGESELLVYDETTDLQFSLMGLEAPENFEPPFTNMVYYNDQVWVGNNASLFRLTPDGWVDVEEIGRVTQTQGVLDMVVGPQSRLWVLFADSVAIFEGNTLLCDDMFACPSLPMDANTLRGLSVSDLSSRVWVYSDVGAENYSFDGVELDAFRGPEVFGLAGNSNLWVLSSINLYRVDQDRRTLPEIKAPLPASELTAIIQQPDQSFLLGSVNGVRSYESFLTTLSDNGLPPESTRFGPCVVDGLRAAGGLWVASRDRITVNESADGSDSVLRAPQLLTSQEEDDGLEISVMRAIAGNVWVGTNRGISVIATAGRTLTTQYRQQLPNAQVTDILSHPGTNTVWVSTLGGGIAYLKDGTWFRVTELDNLRSDTVNALAASDDWIYAATQNGPSAINPTTGRVDDFFNFGNELAEQNAAALDIHFDPSGNRLIVGTNNGLAIRTGNTWEKFQRINGGLPFNSDTEVVRSVSFDGQYVWMVMRRGDSDFPNGTIVRRRPTLADTTGLLQWTPEEIGVPATDSTDGVRLDIEGLEIFLSTCGRAGDGEVSGGLSLLPGRNIELERYSRDSLVGSAAGQNRLMSGFGGVPISTGLTHDGYFSSEQITEAGLEPVELPGRVFASGPTACADDPLRADATVCIFPRTPVEAPPAGGIGLRFLGANGYEWSTTGADTFTALKDGDLRDVAFDSAGVAWVISRQGLVKYEASGTRISLVSQATEPNLISDDIHSLAIQGDRLALGTELGLIIYRPNAEPEERWIRPTGLDDRMASLPVTAIEFDAAGRLYVGTGDGIYVLSSAFEYVRAHSTADGLLSNEINAITVMAAGLVYAGTSGGLNVWDEMSDTWRPVIIGDVLGGSDVYDLFEGTDNRLWFRTNSGIGRLN